MNRTLRCVFAVGALLLVAACTTPGGVVENVAIDVAAGTADAAVQAARECVATPGCDDPLKAAEDAAVQYLILSGVGAVEARYRPFLNAALLGIRLALLKSPSGKVITTTAFDDNQIRAAIYRGIADAERDVAGAKMKTSLELVK